MRRYKVGDKVKITRERHGHQFPIGEIVVIKNLNESGYYGTSPRNGSWWFDDGECMLYGTDTNREAAQFLDKEY